MVNRDCFITVFLTKPNDCVIILVIKDEKISLKKYLLNIFKLIKLGFYDLELLKTYFQRRIFSKNLTKRELFT